MLTFKSPAIAPSLAVLCSMLLGATQVQAHAKLVSADPSANATIAAPTLIQLHFSEEITAKFSSIRLSHAGGAAIAIVTMPARDAKSLSIMPKAGLAPGLYTVTWTAVATDDGHRTTGTFSFTVK